MAVTSASSSSGPPLLKLIFKEQWWCLSALSEGTEESVGVLIKEIEAFANECMAGTAVSDINAVFVPDAAVRERIVKIAQSMRVNVSWVAADKGSTQSFATGRVSVYNPPPPGTVPSPSSSSSSSSNDGGINGSSDSSSSKGGLLHGMKVKLGLAEAEEDGPDEDALNRRTYRSIGNLAFRVRLAREARGGDTAQAEEVRPQHLQQIIFLITGKVIRKYSDSFFFDSSYPPYIFSVCANYEPASPYVAWTTETAQEYKQEIGQWSEIYTGHYDDYRDTTYLARIQSDVSNRKSEMHFINRNSSFIYMDRENYDLYFIKDAETPKSTGYVHNSIIGTVLRIRTIQYFMQIVSKEIDRDQENLSSEDYLEKPPHKIKEDLERTSRMKNALQTMLSPVWTDIARSHRQHYHSVLDRVIFLSNLKGIWRNISDRIDANSRELNAIFLNKQEESSERQESILNTVNTLLGASIIFEIVSYVTADEDVSQVVNRYLSIMIIIIFVLNLLRLRQTARSKE